MKKCNTCVQKGNENPQMEMNHFKYNIVSDLIYKADDIELVIHLFSH